ncbi:hypothetical protein BGZ76_000632 [Entomortierella beljakovae]|nr:hypothetical protein BGZ76_000632 [Entomortierella beljakovae]
MAMKRFSKFFPATLAIIHSGPRINLRDRTIKLRGSFDVVTDDIGRVLPLPLDQKKWTLPNGCSLRSPYSTTFQDVAENYFGNDTNIYIIEKDTPIPGDLVLIHESGDHFSLQCTRAMALQELNDKITEFLANKSDRLSKDAYQTKYPAGKDNDCLNVKMLKEN